MHANEREALILDLLNRKSFIAFRELERLISSSPATIRRDLERLDEQGAIERVRGGAKRRVSASSGSANDGAISLAGAPFHENISRNLSRKRAIGRAAAGLCQPGEGVMIDGGSTTLQMCPHLEGMNLQVLTNSLHIVSALLGQAGTNILVPGGNVFREQNIILTAAGDDLMPRFHAPRLFMGAAAVGPLGVMQPDIVLVASERRLIDRAEEVILLVDSSKFDAPSGNLVCALDEIDVIVTDSGLDKAGREMLRAAGIRIIIAD